MLDLEAEREGRGRFPYVGVVGSGGCGVQMNEVTGTQFWEAGEQGGRAGLEKPSRWSERPRAGFCGTIFPTPHPAVLLCSILVSIATNTPWQSQDSDQVGCAQKGHVKPLSDRGLGSQQRPLLRPERNVPLGDSGPGPAPAPCPTRHQLCWEPTT